MWKKVKRSLAVFSFSGDRSRRGMPESELAKLRGGVLGQMVEGTIHDLRNCLLVISGHEEMLSLSVGDDPALCWHAAEIRNSLERATELVTRLQSLVQTGWPKGDPLSSKSRANGAQPETQSAE